MGKYPSDNTFDKINIYVPNDVYDLLERDLVMFEIFKKDMRTPVGNHFRNMLVQGYYDSFVEENNRLRERILSALGGTGLAEAVQNEVAGMLLDEVKYPGGKKGGKGSRSVSLKPAGKTKDIMGLIPVTEAPSQFFRRMLLSYSMKPLGKREQIVFNETYTSLCKYCAERQPLYLTTIWNPQHIHEVIPFRMASGAEEMYNYLLCQEVNPETHRPEARAYMLHRIASIRISPSKSEPDADVERHILKMLKLGPQYAINDDEEVCVRLNEKGQEYYSRIYFGRPRFDRIVRQEDGYYHYYQCSKQQIFLYFRRFDPINVEILYPASLREDMKSFYKNGFEKYND